MLGNSNFSGEAETLDREQFKLIDRALHGDLQGKVIITERDRELYDKFMNNTNSPPSPDTMMSDCSKRTELSYIPRAQMKAVQEERAMQMGIQAPTPNYSPINQGYSMASPLYPSNPVMSGYRDFSSPYSSQNLGYNPYAWGGGYNYYNPYGYNPYGYGAAPQQIFDVGDPGLNYAISKVKQMSDLNAAGYFDNQYGYYGGYNYYQPQNKTVHVNLNKEYGSTARQFSECLPPEVREHMDKYFESQGLEVIPDDSDIVKGSVDIQVPANMSYPMYGGGQNLVQQVFNAPAPYVYTQQYKDYVQQINYQRQVLNQEICRVVCEYAGVNYDEYCAQAQEIADQQARASLQYIHRYDYKFDRSGMNEYERRIADEEEENMNRSIAHIRNNPYGITWSAADISRYVQAYVDSDREFQMMRKEMPWDMSVIDFMTKGYPAYETRKTVEAFRRRNRQGDLEYDSRKYRDAIMQCGVGGTPYLGASYNRPTYNPSTGQIYQAPSPISDINQKYEQRRASYIAAARTRGGII